MTARAHHIAFPEPLVPLYAAVSPAIVLFARMLWIPGDAARAARQRRSIRFPTAHAAGFFAWLTAPERLNTPPDPAAALAQLRETSSPFIGLAERAIEVTAEVLDASGSIGAVIRAIGTSRPSADREPRRASWEVDLDIALGHGRRGSAA